MRQSDADPQYGQGSERRQSNCFACQNRAQSEWFALADEELGFLNQAKVCNVYKPGQIIFYQGNPCLGIHCIESGSVALRKTDANGHTVIARLFHAGSTLGYLDYFSSQPYSGTAEALTRTRVCFVDRGAVRQLLERNPAIGYRFLGTMARDLRDAEQSKLELVALPLRARLAHLLLVLKERFGEVAEDGTLAIRLPLSRQDIAALLGARPESVSRAIRQLAAARVAQFRGRVVHVPDLDPLLDELEDQSAP
ncbi:MAG: Crp/Fnr family transcriptional regulator [Acidobacteriota bacterium]|nr:MAG: Crp/Fnr family transcriptional regulator [Acidobacteriota bacterium]